MSKTISIVSIKGGIGKSTTCVNLGTALANAGKKVLIIDSDPQFNATSALGITPNQTKLYDLYMASIQNLPDEEVLSLINNSIVSKSENLDVLPSNLSMASLELILPSAMSREYILSGLISMIKDQYSYVLIDCLPSLGLLTVNALTASDSVLIPVEAHYLGTQGLNLILETISKVRKKLNPTLAVEGIIITKYQRRTNYCRDIRALVEETYGEQIQIYDEPINYSIKVAESAAFGKSVIEYDPKGQPAQAFIALAEGVMKNA